MTEIRSIADFLKVVVDYKNRLDVEDKLSAYLRVWYRGHSDAIWDLKPGIFREDVYKQDGLIRTERHLIQDFISFSASLRSGNESDAEIYFLQQHYRMPTRLLDWSYSPLVGLYFAVTQKDDKENDSKDGKVYMLDSFNFSKGHNTERHKYFTSVITSLFDWDKEKIEWPEEILAVRPPSRDPRIIAQQSFFTFHSDGLECLVKEHNPTLEDFIIPKSAKKKIREELDLLNINAFTIFGGLDNLSDWLKSKYQVKT